MTDSDQKQLGRTLWNIADQLRGAMNADDFRDYMLSFLFLRYLSDNYEEAAKKELGRIIPTCRKTFWKKPMPRRRCKSGMKKIPKILPILKSRCAARSITSSSRITSGAASPIWRAR